MMVKWSEAKFEEIQIDDLITIEHTKLKPLTVSIAVEKNGRKILGMAVSRIPAFGHLAAVSRKKYGFRPCKHKEGLKQLFEQIAPVVATHACIQSDEHQLYPDFVRRYLPHARHRRHKSAPSCVAGQGELKRRARDPLFAINHTLAMLRANINRLVRRTWSTSKTPEGLHKHLLIYMDYHNRVLTA
jgi:hypothetical protein